MTILDDAREGMDPSIRPQDDLFGHVNGAWLATVEIPSDRSSWGPFVSLADEAEQKVRQIVEDCASGDGARVTDGGISAVDARKVGDLFASFMDTDRVEALGAEPVRPLLESIDRVASVDGLAAYLGAFERRGLGGLFGSYVSTDDKDSDRYLFHVAQGGLGLPDESYYREDKFAETRAAYVAYVQRMLELADVADAERVAADVLALETRIAEGHWERAETRDVQKTYNLRSAADLQAATPSFDWSAYVAALGGDEQSLAEVIVRQPSYLTHLESLLGEVPIEQWRQLLVVKALRGSAPYLSEAFVETNFDFYGRTLSGTPEMRVRWKRGVSLVEGALGESVGKEYAARHFPPEAKAAMDRLVANLLEAYRRSIGELDWMGEETKQRAYDKLDTFNPKIGYPVKWRDYAALEVDAGDLLGNVLASAAYETDRELAKIGGPVDRDEWFMLPQTVNAYYNPGTNEICFPAGILQRPFFSLDADPAENYGGIGAVIGHEVGHGFDDQGAQYDGQGNLNEWWTPADKEAFEVKTTALVSQYDTFEPRALPGEHVNGQLTVGENIGDLGGLTIAHLAYAISLEGTGRTVGDATGGDGQDAEVTGAQRLFLNWAYVWRTKRRKEQELQYLTIDPHSPPEFRANIVRNLAEFHDAFGTVEGDGLWLAPEERVRIW
ncbi:putative zinc metalloprotease [Marmoricola endophyticus]|uniref:Zinc metalloprotease n=1 Tax=Marmoricola endophyticus TaxID=2040280 RepID=A0A917F2Z4_9ACTN|nr:M13-type metalloendopeptidase [Marmoricola endophyticus]GGF47673.1 putative zinc metalloprotease [Marmoricola endophyticus]